MIEKQVRKHRIKRAASYLRSSEQGFTIIESLVAILVVGILLVAIAPVLSLSVATRVQSRRVELASQAARSYIDAVRTKLVAVPSGPTTATTLSAFAAPTATGTLTCTANSYCTAPTPPTGSSLYCLDLDNSGGCTNNSVADMIVHAFRPNNNDSTQGYALGIRVYRADAFRTSATLLKNTSTTRATQRTYTPGGGQRTAPLLEMTADINDTIPKYSDLCARITGGCTN
ncbi:hormogonium polysaccharide secretion pseudopilin HpsB [Anabaena sp. CCY 9910]|uniref:hormogonium polysaccharide secretion pseudopilin HpsB n=1 Tax=Anabaena sp. CCY 9910 TaxID=3103870 RepID=UPI0039E1A9FC